MSGLTGVSLAILFSNHHERKAASPSHQELCFARTFITSNQFIICHANLAHDNSVQRHAVGIHDCDKDQMVASKIFASLVFLWRQDTLLCNSKVHRWRRRGGGR